MAVIFPIKSTFDPKGVNSAKKAFNGLSTTSKNLAKNVLLPTAALGAVAFKFAKAGENAATANARILQINKSMGLFGESTQIVSDRLVKLAEKTALNTGVDQNAIKLTQAKLLTFRQLAKTADIVGGAFDRATAAAVDMASAGFGDATSNATQLGKALNDPIKGITALTRSGITFTAEEKKLIATLVQSGQTLQAQEMILKAIEMQVGGTAEATANSSDKMKVAFSLVSEQIGTALLPAFDSIVSTIITKIIPAVQAFVNGFSGKVSLNQAMADSEAKAYAWGNVIRAVIETVVNYKKEIIIFGATMVAMWSIVKIAATASAIVTIIAGVIGVYKKLRTAAVLAATAMAFATGGASALTGAAGAVAMGVALTAAFAAANAIADKYQDTITNLPSIQAPDGVLEGAAAYKDIVLPTTGSGSGSGSGSGKGKGSDKAAKDAAKMAKAVAAATKAATKALTKMNDKLSAARQRLAQAKEAFASFRDSLRDSIKGMLNFGDISTRSTGTFLKRLRKQAASIVSFASKIQQLIKMGLSEAAVEQILATGAVEGGKIADALISGGAAAIAETNALVRSVSTAATALGQAGANAFYQAGVTQGQAMVNGIIAAIKKSGFRIVGGFAALPKHLQKALDSGKLTAKDVTELNKLLKGVPALAEGGIVNKPTLALIGEAGPEAVVPLSKMGASGGNVYNITVNAGMGTNGAQVGRDIVDAIKKYERASGPVFASA